ncbi:MAG TPA: TolC family protein [Bacteroidales bacterium]|nr:TolC family protein [Bacteroidales bacterium]
MNNIQRIAAIAGFLCLLFRPGIEAQQKPWTFQQCVDTAIRRNIALNQTRLANETNKVNLQQSKANQIPDLGASVNESGNFGKNINPTTNQYVVQTYNSTNFGVSSSLNLFNGLQNSRTIKQNGVLVDAGNYDIESTKNQVILNITSAYLQVLFSYEILDAAKGQAEATQAQVDRTQKQVDAGLVPELNLYQIQAQLATDKLTVVNDQGQLDLAKVTLMQLMEVPVMDSFDIVKPEIIEPTALISGSHEELFQKALSVRPEIAGASLRTQSALMGVQINKGGYWPKLNLGGNISTNFATSSASSSEVNPNKDPFFTQLWDNIGAGLSLNLSIPIYSNRLYKSNVDRAKINALNVQLSEENTKNQLRKNIEQASTDLKNAINKYSATKDQLTSAEVSYKSIEKKFNVGLVTAIDYLVEKNNYNQAMSNMIQAKYDYVFKSKILDFYIGKQITF